MLCLTILKVQIAYTIKHEFNKTDYQTGKVLLALRTIQYELYGNPKNL